MNHTTLQESTYTIEIFHGKRGVISYIIIDRATREAVVIDIGPEIFEYMCIAIKQQALNVRWIIDTHTHADFFSLRMMLKKLHPHAMLGMHKNAPSQVSMHRFYNNEVITLGQTKIEIWATPGHTADSISLRMEGVIITGDALLIGTTGRTDFQAGNSQVLYDTLQRIATLPNETIVLPGHNYDGISQSTIGKEKESNMRFNLVDTQNQLDFIDTLKAHHPPKPDLFEAAIAWNSL